MVEFCANMPPLKISQYVHLITAIALDVIFVIIVANMPEVSKFALLTLFRQVTHVCHCHKVY